MFPTPPQHCTLQESPCSHGDSCRRLHGLVRNFGLAALVVFVTGCHGANHYYAENTVFGNRLPDTFRLAARSNPKTVDLSRLASSSGSNETIGIGDVIEVKIAAGLGPGDQYELAARVQNDGTVSFPELGVIEIAGIEPQGAESLIRAEAIRRELYKNPTVTVEVTHQRMNKVRVVGAVKNPGIHELPPNASDLLSAIAEAGGLSEDAGQHVEVRNPVQPVREPRPAVAGEAAQPFSNVSSTNSTGAGSTGGGMNSYTVDLISAARSGDGQYVVHDGGVVMVEKRDPAPVYIQGLVRHPNRYEFPIGQDLRLLDAIALAGGMSNQLADKIYVVRQSAGGKDPLVVQVSYRQAKHSDDSNIRLGPGDVVSVEHTPSTVFMEALNIIRFGISGSTTLF